MRSNPRCIRLVDRWRAFARALLDPVVRSRRPIPSSDPVVRSCRRIPSSFTGAFPISEAAYVEPTAKAPRAGLREERDQPQGLVALVFVQCCFAMFPIFVKWTYDGGAFSAASVAAWRIVVGALAFTLPAVFVYGRKIVPPRADLARIVSCALLGVVLNQGLYLQGMTHATALSAGLLMCLIPVFTYAVAVSIGQERVTSRRALGVVIALLGAGPLAIRDLSVLQDAGAGNLLLVANAFCYSAYLVISKPLLLRHPPLVVIAWVYLLSVPAAPLFARGATLWPEDASSHARTGLLLILIFPTVLGYFLGIFALARTRASTSAAFVYLQPLITGAAAVLILGEVATRSLILPGLLLLVGLWLVTRKK